MVLQTRSSTKPRDDRPETSWNPRKRQRVGDSVDVETAFVRPKLGSTKRSTEVQLRGSKKKPKKREASTKDQGKLTALMELPLDILSEVTSFLTPADILQLSRVSTNFRQLFNPYTACHFWVNARRNLPGMPECPQDLNEAQYASLIFEKHCQACGTERGYNIDFVLRHRTCKSCHRELTKKGNIIVKSLGGEKPDPTVYRLIPPCIDSIAGLETSIDGYDMRRYNVRELTSAVEQYLRLNENKKEQQVFVEEREKLTQMMTETGNAMLEWHNNQKKQNEEEDRVKSQRRLQEANKRLAELGWTQEDINTVRDTINAYMYQPQELTPRIWKQTRPILENALMYNRRHNRDKELEKLWRPALQKVIPTSEWVFVPDNRAVANLPCVHILLERNNAGIKLTSQALEDIIPTVLQETRPRQDAVKRIFLRAILGSEEYALPLLERRKTRTKLFDKQISPDDPRLFYARHLFYCNDRRCNERNVMTLTMFYDHVQSTHNILEPKKWAVGLVESDTIQDVVKEILKVMELPEDVRVEDVERFGQKLQCDCDKQRKFGFVSLIQHFYDHETCESHLPSKVSQLVSVQ